MRKISSSALLFVVLACKSPAPTSALHEGAAPPPAQEAVSLYTSKIQPIFDAKCVGCHACSQAPCQLNLTSYDGLRRGAQDLNLYAKRLTRVEPSRLFTDGASEDEWRGKGFWSVTGTNSGSSILWEMLDLKAAFPGEKIKDLPEAALLDGDMCQSLEDHKGDIADFREHFRKKAVISGRSKRAYGMPYGLPGLSGGEAETIKSWLDQGAPGPSDGERRAAKEARSAETVATIAQWEAFLNGTSAKERLVARYIYEHLFLARLYFGDDRASFKAGTEGEFWQLVRAKEASGPVETVSRAVHPYDDAALGGAFHYRFRKFSETVMHKNHVTYRLNPKKMERFKELFVTPEFTVSGMPPYGPEGSNPFKTYAEIPAKSRYLFLLDDAEFFTDNDIRGPVCSGKFAVNVIQDLGWRMYVRPEADPTVRDPGFFQRKDDKGRTVADLLAMPAETQTTTLAAAEVVLKRDFLVFLKSYLEVKDKAYAELQPKLGIDDIYDAHEGAVQTIFRNHDSAVVMPGLLAGPPKTAELFDYPLMERTYYNLVTGFDVYGSSIDGFNTRAYKDGLRVEAEDSYLKLVPHTARKDVREWWYYSKLHTTTAALRAWMKLWNPLFPTPSAERDTRDSYEGFGEEEGEAVSNAVHRRVAAHFRKKGLGRPDHINCPDCGENAKPAAGAADLVQRFKALKKTGAFVRHLPEVTFVRVDDEVFTLLPGRFRTHTKYMLADFTTEEPERDELAVVDELVGSYPNLFVQVSRAELPEMLAALEGVDKKSAYEAFRKRWGVARDDERVWELATWFHSHAAKRNPVEAGRFDLARYELFYR